MSDTTENVSSETKNDHKDFSEVELATLIQRIDDIGESLINFHNVIPRNNSEDIDFSRLESVLSDFINKCSYFSEKYCIDNEMRPEFISLLKSSIKSKNELGLATRNAVHKLRKSLDLLESKSDRADTSTDEANSEESNATESNETNEQ